MRKSIDPVQRLIELIRGIDKRVKRLETAPRLQNSSVDDGALWILSPEGLVVGEPGTTGGSAKVNGALLIVGTLDLSGVGTVEGRLSVEGAGVLTVKSLIDLLGDMRVRAGGKILVGDMIIDESDGGSVTFPSGAKVAASADGPGIVITSGAGPRILITDDSMALLQASGDANLILDGPLARLVGDVVQINASERLMFGIPSGDASDAVAWMGRDATGRAFWASAATGGPVGSGEFAWPFSLSTVTREYGPGYEEYEDGVHKGIDFGIAGGTPIPAPANGTVTAKAYEEERGNYLIISHGTQGGYELTTRYYHLQSPSPLGIGDAVAKGETVGLVGSTGLSTGNHLHYETRRNGEHMNPRSFMSIYGE